MTDYQNLSYNEMLQCLYRDSLKHVTKCLQLDDKDDKHKIPKDIEKGFPDLPPDTAEVFKKDINYAEFLKLKEELVSRWQALLREINAAIKKSTDCTPILQIIWRMKRNAKVKQQLPSIHLSEHQQNSTYRKQFQVLLAVEEVLKLDAKYTLHVQEPSIPTPGADYAAFAENASIKGEKEKNVSLKKNKALIPADNELVNEEIEALKQEIALLKEENTSHKKKYAILKEEHEILKVENESLTARLCGIAGTQHRDDNSDIFSLCDKNRPTKLSEMFRVIYDDEWTSLLDHITDKSKMTETQAIRQILSSLKDIFYSSKFETENIIKRSLKILGIPDDAHRKQNANVMDEHIEYIKCVKDIVKRTVEFRCDSNLEWNKELITVKTLLKNGGVHAETFITKCSRWCLFMSVQDPPVFLDFSFKSGDPFDANLLSHFTSSGEIIDYLVWPVMYLNEHGAILSKGVAQGKWK